MISNNTITYASVEPMLFTWRAENSILHSFLVSTLTSVLAYQTTAIFFDAFFGLKQPGEAEITDVGTVLLAEESSLLSVIANLFGSNTLVGWRIRGFKSKGPKEKGKYTGITVPVRAKLLFLCLLAPFVSIGSIAISLENDITISFKDAKFGGIALGINENQSTVAASKLRKACGEYNTTFGSQETSMAFFYGCSFLFFGEILPYQHLVKETTLSISQTVQEEIKIQVYRANDTASMALFRADVRIGESAYRLRERISQEQGKSVLKYGERVMLDGCSGAGPVFGESESSSPIVSFQGEKWNISQVIECSTVPDEVIFATLESMLRFFTVVDAEKFEIVNVLDLAPSRTNDSSVPVQFVEGDGMPLLKRRRSYVGFPILCITVAIVLACRVAVRMITNNDIDMGIETIMKEQLGIKCCDSMLQSRAKVDYSDDKFLVKD